MDVYLVALQRAVFGSWAVAGLRSGQSLRSGNGIRSGHRKPGRPSFFPRVCVRPAIVFHLFAYFFP